MPTTRPHALNFSLILFTFHFQIVISQGPYESIPGIYMLLLALWVALNGLWSYYVYRVYAESALPISKALLSLLPIARLLIAAFSLIFWYGLSFVTLNFYFNLSIFGFGLEA